MKSKFITMTSAIVIVLVSLVGFSLLAASDSRNTMETAPTTNDALNGKQPPHSPKGLHAQNSDLQSKEADLIQKSSKSYTEVMSGWNRPTKPEPQNAAKELNQRLSESAAVGARAVQSISEQATLDIDYYKQLVQTLLDENEIDLAYDYATLLYQANPYDEENKETFAKVYKLYSDFVVNRQNEIRRGGAE